MKKVTPNNCQKIIEGVKRLGVAGVEVQADIDLGSPVILRRVYRNSRTEWEILPKSIAELTLQGIPENEPKVARARIFRSPPREAPEQIKVEWIYRGLRRRRLGEDSLSFPSN